MTKEHVQLLLGRVGEGSALWINGDFKQCDAEVFRKNSGLMVAVDKPKGHPRFGYVKLLKTEMKKLTIFVDMDDTIENLLSVWVAYLNERYGLRVKTDDVRDWDLSLAYPSLTSKQVFHDSLLDHLPVPIYDQKAAFCPGKRTKEEDSVGVYLTPFPITWYFIRV